MAKTLIECAVQGQRNAMTELYGKNKDKVYYIALCLLGDESLSADAVAWSFKNVWESMVRNKVSTEDEFTFLAVRKAVDFCKKKLLSQDQKAFKLPQNKNFYVAGDKIMPDDTENIAQNVLCELPILQRVAFVLDKLAGYDKQRLASTLKFDEKSAAAVLEAQKSNVEHAFRFESKSKKLLYDEVVRQLTAGEKNAVCPSAVDKQIAEVIDGIAKPLEMKRKKMTAIISAAVALCLAVIVIIIIAVSLADDNDTTDSGTSVGESPNTYVDIASEPLDPELTYYADIEIAEYGTITVKLDQSAAPITCENFVSLAKAGFYDGLNFHRIIEGFMMQGGAGNDEKGYADNIVGEFTSNGYENNLSHTRGAISMARTDVYNSATSQFFIVQEDTTRLDGDYAVFGYVTEGIEVVDAVCEAAEPIDDNGGIAVGERPVITSITIRTE